MKWMLRNIWNEFLEIYEMKKEDKKNNNKYWYINCALNNKHLLVGSYDYRWSGKNEYVCKKSLKIPKGQSEAVLRRTDNTMTKRKRTNNDLQNITQNTEDRATRTSLKTGGESRCSGRVISFCSTFNTRRVTVKRHEHQEIIRGTGISFPQDTSEGYLWTPNVCRIQVLFCDTLTANNIMYNDRQKSDIKNN